MSSTVGDVDIDQVVEKLRVMTRRLDASEERSAHLDELLRIVLNVIPDSVIVRDVEDHILYCNEAFARMHETRPEALVGAPLIACFSAEDAAKVASENRAVRESGEADTFKQPLEDGRGVHYVTKLPFYDGGPDVMGTVTIARDITPIEEELRVLRGRVEELSAKVNGLGCDAQIDRREAYA